MATKIAIMNIKGGVGKTATALNIADQLMLRGKRVLLVDLDTQGNTSSVVRSNLKKGTPTLYDIFISGYTAKQVIQKTPFGYVIPGDNELQNADTMIKVGPNMYKYLKRALADVEDMFDYIILDTAPHFNVILGNAFCCSDKIILPTECSYFGVQGMRDFYNLFLEFKEDNPNLEIMGILRTKYIKRRRLITEIDENLFPQQAELLQTKIFNTKISFSSACEEAIAARMRLSEYAPKSAVAMDYSNLVDEIIKEVEG